MALINLRNALMAGKRLPYDAEVEYLESTGTQYIDTGVKPSSDLRTKFRAAYTHTPIENNSTIFGSRSTASSNDRYWLNYDSKFEVGYGSYYNTGVTVSPGEMFDVDFNYIENGDHKFKINDSVFTYSGTPNTTIGIILFGRIVGAQVTRCSSRFYSAQFFRNGVLIRDFIPVRKGTVGYLYDRVSGKLFGNAGTGDFVLGPDVVPVEYIESHGTEWINTGFKSDNTCKISVDMENRANVRSSWVFGSRNGSSSAIDKSCLFMQVSDGSLGYAMLGSGMVEFDSSLIKNNRHTVEMSLADGVVVDGVAVATFTPSQQTDIFTNTFPMALFNLWNGSSLSNYFRGRIYGFSVKSNGILRLKYAPVRVGTEGAMMDTLTRRIYRNAGTGAFGYGNDLKYPIPS